MLILKRKPGQTIVLNGVIKIHILAMEGDRVKVGIDAPADVIIERSELLDDFAPLYPVPPKEVPRG